MPKVGKSRYSSHRWRNKFRWIIEGGEDIGYLNLSYDTKTCPRMKLKNTNALSCARVIGFTNMLRVVILHLD